MSPASVMTNVPVAVGWALLTSDCVPFQRSDSWPSGEISTSLPRVEMDERVEWALKKAALWNEVKDKLQQSGSSLSGGQQQRLCIARGIAIKPEVLLLDEPCSALDPISTGKIEELIHELKNDYTIAIVTHNMQQGARVSDYTAYMYLRDLVEFGQALLGELRARSG